MLHTLQPGTEQGNGTSCICYFLISNIIRSVFTVLDSTNIWNNLLHHGT